jgi:molybdate transport system substrate-binding protein
MPMPQRRWTAKALAVALTMIVGALTAGAGAARAADTGPRVLAAISLKEVLDDLARSWVAQGGAPPVIAYGGTPTLVRQIEQGAPFDLVISADAAWMDTLEQSGRVLPGSRANFAGNRLVLIAAAASPLSLQAAPRFDLAGALGASGRLAVADVRTVPAGRYARAALESLGVWSSVSQRLAMTENVRAALLLVARGEAPVGIVYATDARAEPGVKVLSVFAADAHPPIVYPMALAARSPTTDARGPLGSADSAARFVAFLRSPKSLALLNARGFIAPVP